MEEIINLNGRQFKLSTDRPLTALEREQAIADIRKQTGCGTCGTMSMARMGNDWQYGGITDLTVITAPSSVVSPSKTSTDTITLTATPNSGVGPYNVYFWRLFTQAGGPLAVGSPHGAVGEGIPASESYVISDADAVAAVGDTGALAPTDVVPSTGALVFTGGATTSLAAGSIRHFVSIVDSCTGVGGPGVCAQWADTAITCVAPTCNFVVT